MTIAIVALGESGATLGRRLAAVLPESVLHGLAGRVETCDVAFDDVGAHLRELFRSGQPIIGMCAAGVLIRALAPVLRDKASEPPVIALAEDASAVVPLLGGHHGANALARRLGAILGVAPAVTTAGDLRLGVALDEPPHGWHLANPEPVKAFAAALLAGEPVRVEGEAAPLAGWLTDSRLKIAPGARLAIEATGRAIVGAPDRLVYHPAVLALGVGCERGAAPAELVDLARATLAETGLAEAAVAVVVSLDLKADEPAVHAVAAALGRPARFFPATALEAETPRLANPSDAVFRAVGCHGVAEAAALAAVGPEGRLVVAKRRSARATCAIARALRLINPAAVGRPRGRLAIVGLGPGDPAWLTPEARALVGNADDLVGYGRYLDLLGPLASNKRRHIFPLGAEEARCRAALDLAAAGGAVALVSSGDPGIYAMASLVIELMDRVADPAWHRIELRVAPGISAMQAAAARLGAPLGHDFCAISLSDLLTPWPIIERRIDAAGAGDFAIAFYNPVSQRRDRQLVRARDILLRHRPADTPAMLARNLGRPGEAVRITTLAALDTGAADMLTVVLVGNRATRRLVRSDGGVWVYTPRGYATGRAVEHESPAPAALDSADFGEAP